jgi:hypothetical protein
VEVGVSCALSVRRIIGTVMYAEAVIVDMWVECLKKDLAYGSLISHDFFLWDV